MTMKEILSRFLNAIDNEEEDIKVRIFSGFLWAIVIGGTWFCMLLLAAIFQ